MLKGWTQQAPGPLKQVLLCGVNPCMADPPWWSQPVHAVHQHGGKSLALTCLQQLRLNYNMRVHAAYMGGVHLCANLGD